MKCLVQIDLPVGDASARRSRKVPDASDNEKPVMTTILFNFGMVFFVPQLFLIGLWTMGKTIEDYPSSGRHSAPLTENAGRFRKRPKRKPLT
jgi:hypothetical protein